MRSIVILLKTKCLVRLTFRQLFFLGGGILDLQPIPRESLDNVARPLRLVPTIELIKYSFVPHHQHGRRASQE